MAVVSLVMTDGALIHGKASSENTAVREGESLAAAKLLDMECAFLRFADGHFQPTDEARLALVREIRTYCPAIVVTHSPSDYHLDHINTSRCAFEAVSMAWNPCVLSDVPTCPRPKLYYADNWFVHFEPDEYCDISDTIDLKLDMFRCHKSQLRKSGESEGDMVDLARQQSRTRGIEAGVRYAEAFRLVPAFRSVRIASCLGE